MVSDSNTPERQLDRSRVDPANSRRAESTSRRAFVQAAGATSLAASGLALGRPAVATGRYDRIADVVEDYDADPTGGESVHDALYEAMADDTKIVFPEGTYTFDEQVWQVNFGSGKQNNPRSNRCGPSEPS